MVTRTYRCPSCEQRFRVFGMAADDGAPPCPKCNWQESEWVPEAIAITGSRSKAIDITQQIAEKQFGLTNMADNLREGDVAVPLNPTQSKMAENFWGGAKENTGAAIPAAQVMGAASQWAGQSRREGYDPITLALSHKRQPQLRQTRLGPDIVRQDLGIPKE
jgi:hypothetical protein